MNSTTQSTFNQTTAKPKVENLYDEMSRLKTFADLLKYPLLNGQMHLLKQMISVNGSISDGEAFFSKTGAPDIILIFQRGVTRSRVISENPTDSHNGKYGRVLVTVDHPNGLQSFILSYRYWEKGEATIINQYFVADGSRNFIQSTYENGEHIEANGLSRQRGHQIISEVVPSEIIP